MSAFRSRWLAILVLAAVAGGCGPAQTTTPPFVPTKQPAVQTAQASPTLSLTDILRVRGQETIPQLLAGASAPPFILDWSKVESQATLTIPQRNAFCETLDLPGIDDGLSSLLFLGMNALSLRFRHKALPEDAEKALGIAVTFAAKTCPSWIPKPTATRPPPWYPAGYSAVTGDPNVVWKWNDPSLVSCAPSKPCWEIFVIAKTGCATSLTVKIDVLDKTGAVIDSLESRAGVVEAGKVWKFPFATKLAAGAKGHATYVICR